MSEDRGGLSFMAAFRPTGKCLQVDTDGEALIQLVIPDTDTPKVIAAFPLLKDRSFRVTLNAE